MSPECTSKYKVFKSAEVVERNEVKAIIREAERDKKSIVIVEGDRGAGKTYTLLSIYHHYLHRPDYQPFFVGLFPYEAPEFTGEKNIWLSPDRKFTTADISDLLKKITTYLGIDFVESLDPENQREYLAKKLAQRTTGDRPVVLIDSIYECDEGVRRQLERDLLVPLLASSQVTFILSGRGKRPSWTAPEFRGAECVKLEAVDEEFVSEQLQKMKSRHVGESKTIMDWSSGCPLVVRLLGEAEQVSIDALSGAIDVLIGESLPDESINDKYAEIREAMQKLSLFKTTFRDSDVVYYLFGDDPDGRSRATRLFRSLLDGNLLEWDDTDKWHGYKMNETVTGTLYAWLTENKDSALLTEYRSTWKEAVNQLGRIYPSVQSQSQEYISRIS